MSRSEDTAAEAQEAARAALAAGQFPRALERLRPHLSADSPAALRYLAALAHARMGALAAARRWLAGVAEACSDPRLRCDALALSGRIAKDAFARLPEGERKMRAADEAIAAYLDAWKAFSDPYPGVNAATLMALAGRREDSRALARQVLDGLLRRQEAADAWLQASRGELHLLLGEHDAAARAYGEAAALKAGQLGDLASMRRQLRLLSTTEPMALSLLDLLSVPRIAVFSGHMVDAADRPTPRFPAALCPAVEQAIDAEIDRAGIGIGYVSAACGGDLLFIEALQRRGAEVHVVLPFASEDFCRLSVDHAGAGWRDRFEAALAAANSVRHAVDERYLGDVSLFDHAGKLMMGAAWLHAAQLQTDCLMLALLDEDSEPRPGGTRSLLEHWRLLGRNSRVINLSALREAAGRLDSQRGGGAPAEPARPSAHRREVVTMLFADMVGYSRLAEEDTPAYLQHFLGRISGLLGSGGTPPRFANTWGDGLFLVFDQVDAAAECALRIRDAVSATDWSKHGLPAETALRIGMHSGPVFRARDPLLGRENFFGSHVTRAARIEPITPPGEILISEESACLLAAEPAESLAADYVGPTPLAKRYRPATLYRLRRRHETG
ncbi:adenylate/guanylate cyclase domain-containing protein [Pseudomarimonas salicorniae]|uniref:TRAFs-binding domain-containing protein n=1 Tax=Pseudomarimonas salicorniae TaxID=2933270 RepID=A0ABT0GFT0_9GAMM|nr:adenylate/guanylate cyclase domain-containing protein [Lysobacter sp. CAU 1642]MCK7593390.1 TRAFs-binding domain-containing protein [Lysobacter sp. CAU 1642]